ncbi:hypothetical protein RAH41_14190 [Gottfriedia acidiceleris]|uniref:hypothetical protein n=1 Tax=Gottfriedia acidiceleris TaxID=371036 RepID=UPI002F25EEE6
MEKLNLQIPKIEKHIGLTNSLLDSIQHDLEQSEANKKRKEQENIQRQIQLNEMIQKIVENTAYLPEMVGLIRKNNEINEEMLELFNEMTNVLKAKNAEEAKSIVMDVVEKAKNTKDALDAMSSLLTYGKLLIKLVFPDSN